MGTRSSVKDLRERRRQERLDAIAQNALRQKKLRPGEKLDNADDLIRNAWSLHDAAKKSLARRRR